MSGRFDDALSDCLDRMAKGEDQAQCLGRYPQHRRELEPLLRVASMTFEAAAASYRPEAKDLGLARLRRALAERGATVRRRGSLFRLPLTRPLVIGFAAVLLTALAAGGTAVAASDSVPGEPLYWVKKTRDNLSLVMARSDDDKARTHVRLARERGEELRRLIAQGQMRKAERMVARLNRHLTKSAAYTGIPLPLHSVETPARPPRLPDVHRALKLRHHLERDGTALRTDLAEVLRNVHPKHRNRAQLLMIQSQQGYRSLVEVLYQSNAPARPPFTKFEPTRKGER